MNQKEKLMSNNVFTDFRNTVSDIEAVMEIKMDAGDPDSQGYVNNIITFLDIYRDLHVNSLSREEFAIFRRKKDH